MTQPSPTAKLSSSHGERRIRVLVGNHQGNGFHALTIAENEIQGVAEMGQDRSALVLRSGTEISVALPYEVLEEKVYERDFRTDGPVLDLRAVTGPPANAANANHSDGPTSASETKPEAKNANETARPEGGDRMPDRSVCAGISPDTNKPMYVTPADAPLSMTFNEAQKYAAQLDAHGHRDWRIPTKNELCVMFNHRADIGGFNLTGHYPAGWYWSSSPNDIWSTWGQRFCDGGQNGFNNDHRSSVRCVR